MAGKIRLLPDDVIGKIAAGEVVERPAAAIKEMVENSLDAGATAVTVEIRDGGISYFRVTDNGSGIRQSEIRMAFERHATSKISNAQELTAIRTLGFRGEALASIAAVSRVTCTTRTKDDVSGVKIINNGGVIEHIEEVACSEGTSFVVRDLFFNTPVRLKFLKKPATETGYVSDLMMRLILSRPDVSFRYISQGKTLYHSAGDGKMSSAIFSIYGKEIRTMQEVEGHQAGVLIKGYVGVGDSGRATRAHQSFFINGRYMKSGVLSAGVEAACKERLPQGRYPTCILHLTMPYDMVDVNVHPNKLECRFQNDHAMAEAMEQIIRDVFAEQNPLDKAQILPLSHEVQPQTAPVSVKKQDAVVQPIKQTFTVEKVTNIPKAVPVVPPARKLEVQQPVQLPAAGKPQEFGKKQSESNREASEKPISGEVKLPVPPMKPLQPLDRPKPMILQDGASAVQNYVQACHKQVPLPQVEVVPAARPEKTQECSSFLPEKEKTLKLIGTVFDSYILVEYDNSLLLIDQQGVHERLLFDRMMKAFDDQTCSQELLLPLIVPATRKEQQLLETHQALLRGIGLTVESFGETEVSIRSIPMILGKPQAGDLLREIIDQLEGERGVISLEKRRAGILALACKKAVRRGERLNEADLKELVFRMVDRKIIPTSPRGTPLIVALTHSDIDRRFRRPQ